MFICINKQKQNVILLLVKQVSIVRKQMVSNQVCYQHVHQLHDVFDYHVLLYVHVQHDKHVWVNDVVVQCVLFLENEQIFLLMHHYIRVFRLHDFVSKFSYNDQSKQRNGQLTTPSFSLAFAFHNLKHISSEPDMTYLLSKVH